MSFSEMSGSLPLPSLPREPVLPESDLSKFEIFLQKIEAIFKDFLALIDQLFSGKDQEWTPMPNSRFNTIVEGIKRQNLRNLMLPEDLLLGKKDTTSLTSEQKVLLLERIHQIKKDFYHQCMDDVSLLPSNLDGNTSTDSLMGFLFDLHAMRKCDPQDVQIQEMLEVVSETYKFALEREAIERLIDKQEQAFRKEEYIGKLTNRISSMKAGDRFVYQTSVAHHALLLEFKVREEAGQRLVDVKLMNSGMGVENHYSESFFPDLNPNAKYQSYMVEGANLESLVNSPFFKKLVENEVPGEVKGAHFPLIGFVMQLVSDIYHELSGVDKVYKLINVHVIKETGGKTVISKDIRHHHLPQNKGICSRKIYEYWLRENLKTEIDFELFRAQTLEYSLQRLKLAELLEQKFQGSVIKVDSFKDRIFIQPHWLSKGIACIRGHLKTRTMVLIGDQILTEQRRRIKSMVEEKVMEQSPIQTLPF